jgi:transposase InsO family protein
LISGSVNSGSNVAPVGWSPESDPRHRPIAPSTYYEHKAREVDPGRARPVCDAIASPVDIQRVWEANFEVYGARKVWRQLNRQAIVVRPLHRNSCVIWGCAERCAGGSSRRRYPSEELARPLDQVNRNFVVARPNALWVSDLTYVATWRGFVYVAFVIDAFARRIVGWRASNSLRTDLALDALEQALYDRCVNTNTSLVHHGDHGRQYLSIRYTERLAEAGFEPSVGSVGDSYDNALVESIIGLYKTEVIRRRDVRERQLLYRTNR